MPHATSNEMDIDEGSVIQQFLSGHGVEGGAEYPVHTIDQGGKADDAVDYEDISDDDNLPEEEEATNHLDESSANQFFVQHGLGPMPDQPQTNGYHEKEHTSDDLFGVEEGNDLFGERFSSPEQDRHDMAPAQSHASHASGGLALPSKSGLALPGYNGALQPASWVQQPRAGQPPPGPKSASSPSARQHGFSHMTSTPMEESDEEDLTISDPLAAAQMRLFKESAHKGSGQTGTREGASDVDMDRFWSLFPGHEDHQNPKFTKLFPQRRVQFRGKLPPKPPKPVQPTKLSLDLLQDQERSFKSAATAKHGQNLTDSGNIIFFRQVADSDTESGDGDSWGDYDPDDRIGGMTMEDLALACQDWDPPLSADEPMEADWEAEELARPAKRQKLSILDADLSTSLHERQLAFDDPERAVAKVAKAVVLDLNDVRLLVDEHASENVRKAKRMPGDVHPDPSLSKDLAKRYNISNDEAYDLLKENHQHKVRSMLGGTTIEHSLPATRLQYPFYKVALDTKSKRSFHRPALDLKLKYMKEEFKMGKLKTIKKKERKGKDIKEIFATAESLALNDNASLLLLEYSEEAPMMLSNFGMGSKLINYYRKLNADDQTRPKGEIGETQVLLTQDKSPFANFGHVDQGETVPTIQNSLYRAPVFQHQAKPTDFLVAISTTYSYGSRMYLRNLENLHTVGQQLPISEVPGQNSRKVTDAAKQRLRAIAYRIYTKSQDPTRRNKQLDNATIMAHLKGHDMPQTRSKMREFMKYERPGNRDIGVWVPPPGQPVPDAETLRSWVRPEQICLLDSMQYGVQHLQDLGITLGNKDEDDKDVDDDANIELKLAPWQATKNFIHATQGKAMLSLHGEGDPTGRGDGISFVKTSMKGGFQSQGESIEDKIQAKKRRENGGHSYNVASQQKAYDREIRKIWDTQKNGLSSNIEVSDTEMEDDIDVEPDGGRTAARMGTPRSSFAGTPAAAGRRDDETGTQFSRASTHRTDDRVLVITRKGRDAYGNEASTIEKVTNPKVIREYRKRRNEKRVGRIDFMNYKPTGEDPELDRLVEGKVREEMLRVQRNQDRRRVREAQKARALGAGSPPVSAVGSPGRSEAEGEETNANGTVNGGADATPQKGRGRNKDGTARKCANCGQVGHIKTNRKSVHTFPCLYCHHLNRVYPKGDRVEDLGLANGVGNAASATTEKSSAPEDSFSAFAL